MTRRSALRKFGITTGMSVFGLFAVDDLARMVIGKMQEHEATRKIAENLAQEFKDAGAVYGVTELCSHCCRQLCADASGCTDGYVSCLAAGGSAAVCDAALNACENQMQYDYGECYHTNCPKGYACPACQQ